MTGSCSSGGCFDSGAEPPEPEPQHNFRVTEGSATLTADGAWVDITSYTNAEGEDDSAESTVYYSLTSGVLTMLESGTLFFLYMRAAYENADTPADASDIYAVDFEMRLNGSSTIMSMTTSRLKGSGEVTLGTYEPGQALSSSDEVMVRARVSFGSVDVNLSRLDWGVRWIE